MKDAQLTAAYFVAFIALGLTAGSLGPTLPALAEQTHVGLSAISYLFTARSLGFALAPRELENCLIANLAIPSWRRCF